MYPTRVVLACLARTSCINAAMTARGMQQIGLAYVLEPALRELYPEPQAFARAMSRYAGHSNTHPFMIPLFVGILLSLEQAIAKGTLPEGALNSVRETLATTLSALGDSFFSGTLLPLWSLLSISLLLAGFTNIAMLLAVILFGSLLLFRSICFVSGLRYGLTTLARLRKLNLINWVDRLKMVNAALAALVIWHLPISTMKPFPWTAYAMGAAAVLAAAWLVGRMRLPRLLLWVVTTGALILVDLGFIGM